MYSYWEHTYAKHCARNKIIILKNLFFVESPNYYGLKVSPTLSTSIFAFIVTVQWYFLSNSRKCITERELMWVMQEAHQASASWFTWGSGGNCHPMPLPTHRTLPPKQSNKIEKGHDKDWAKNPLSSSLSFFLHRQKRVHWGGRGKVSVLSMGHYESVFCPRRGKSIQDARPLFAILLGIWELPA